MSFSIPFFLETLIGCGMLNFTNSNDRLPFEQWDGKTFGPSNLPSKYKDRQVEVYGAGTRYCLKFNKSQIINLLLSVKLQTDVIWEGGANIFNISCKSSGGTCYRDGIACGSNCDNCGTYAHNGDPLSETFETSSSFSASTPTATSISDIAAIAKCEKSSYSLSVGASKLCFATQYIDKNTNQQINGYLDAGDPNFDQEIIICQYKNVQNIPIEDWAIQSKSPNFLKYFMYHWLQSGYQIFPGDLINDIFGFYYPANLKPPNLRDEPKPAYAIWSSPLRTSNRNDGTTEITVEDRYYHPYTGNGIYNDSDKIGLAFVIPPDMPLSRYGCIVKVSDDEYWWDPGVGITSDLEANCDAFAVSSKSDDAPPASVACAWRKNIRGEPIYSQPTRFKEVYLQYCDFDGMSEVASHLFFSASTAGVSSKRFYLDRLYPGWYEEIPAPDGGIIYQPVEDAFGLPTTIPHNYVSIEVEYTGPETGRDEYGNPIFDVIYGSFLCPYVVALKNYQYFSQSQWEGQTTETPSFPSAAGSITNSIGAGGSRASLMISYDFSKNLPQKIKLKSEK